MRRRKSLSAVPLLVLLLHACGEAPGGGSGGTGGTGTGGGGAGGGGAGGGGAGDAAPAPAPDAQATGGQGGSAPDAPPAMAGDCTPAQPKSLFCDPLRAMPKSLKETGLFPFAPDLGRHPASLIEYSPSPALWSDGLEKQRFLLLPAGKKIDNSDRKKWAFPVGTLFVKTFFDDSGAGGKPRAIETRIIRRVGEATAFTEYDYYLYEWSPQGDDATLLVDDQNGNILKDKPVMVTIKRTDNGQPFAVNGGQPFPHVLPSRQACDDCHLENGKQTQTFIGFDELRLNSKLTASSARTQLQDLADAGIFKNPPPSDPVSLPDSTNPADPLPRVKRFVFGNCVHCHYGGAQFDLRPEVFEQNTVNKDVDPAQSVAPPKGWKRVFPGDPLKSVVYVQTRRTMLPAPTGGGNMNRLRPMPPVGVSDQAVDQAALADMEAWIRSLPPPR
jgi:hypothetical protein